MTIFAVGESCADHVVCKRDGLAMLTEKQIITMLGLAACWRLAGNRNKHHVIGTSAIPTNSELACCDLQYLLALKMFKCCILQCLLVLQNFKCCNLDELQA